MKVVFLRAANVGGKNVFRPTQLVKALAHLDVVNIGAAGTVVIRERVSMAAARAAILERLTFAPSMVIRPAAEIVALGLWRRRPDGVVMPSNAIETALGVSATVRWWETFQRIAKAVGG
jgi:hypothetical protein